MWEVNGSDGLHQERDHAPGITDWLASYQVSGCSRVCVIVHLGTNDVWAGGLGTEASVVVSVGEMEQVVGVIRQQVFVHFVAVLQQRCCASEIFHTRS